MADQRVISKLNRLYRIVRAGELGFEVAASNMENRGLKMLLKKHAQERARFAEQLAAEIKRLGGRLTQRESIRGVIHRGRINIFAALTIGAFDRENVVLGEAVKGEGVAVRTYENALKADLSPETRGLLEAQFERIQAVSDQARQLRGRGGLRLIVRLFDSEQDAEAAVYALQAADFSVDSIDKMTFDKQVGEYHRPGNPVSETLISGAFGGALWGSLFGILAGGGILLLPGLDPFRAMAIQATWAFVAVLSTVFGAILGGILGLFVGIGISEEDIFLSEDSLKHGAILIIMQTDSDRAPEASQIMSQINVASRAQAGQASG